MVSLHSRSTRQTECCGPQPSPVWECSAAIHSAVPTTLPRTRGLPRLALKPRPALVRWRALSGRRERTDRNVISVRISERELLGLSVRIHLWLLFEPSDERACPLKRQVEIIDTEEQQAPVAGCPVIGGHQRGMLVGAPLVEAEQDSSI